jgi:hypothetical protein
MKTHRVEQLPTPADCLLSKANVMARLGIGNKALRRLVATGQLSVVKLSRTSPLKFRELAVRQLIEASTVTAPTAGAYGGWPVDGGKEPTP